MTPFAAALSIFPAARVYSCCIFSVGPSRASRKRLMWVLRLRLTARLRRRRFSLLRRFFLALRVCGIGRLSPESGNRRLVPLKRRIITPRAAPARAERVRRQPLPPTASPKRRGGG